MTGRARGRARGRSRGQTAPAGPKPGEQVAQATPSEPQVGRGGRGRAAAATAQPQAAPVKQPTPQAQVPVQEMAKMTVQEPQQPAKEPTPPGSGTSVGHSSGRGYGTECYTRPDHIKDKCGSSGTPIRVMSNFIALKNRPECALYQYHVTYNPPIDSKRLRSGLLYSQEDLMGKTHSFDGMILYLPKKLPKEVTEFTTQTRDGTNVKVTITLTNELNVNSPTCIQLFNIIFRK